MQSSLWKVYSLIIGTVSTIAAKQLVAKSWELITGDEPPEPGDPDTPLRDAVIWSIASAVGVSVVQLMTDRSTLRRMRKALDDDALPSKKIKVKI
ncbi:hypothetical protein CGZ93_08670 [Enemella dayhoffiae]|uniref:DUF4235 domain-containing protein n=1 Tax=Enemella dayhoffiae TaxID=2016507 RepID=A0A255H2Y8_9ACTN|nr:DUF4235 domain-containing protein [Enemella dayhoffiae]OYO21991.1 hypothetical protein CGZ93_08670 [Enemella dayhoffiae]